MKTIIKEEKDKVKVFLEGDLDTKNASIAEQDFKPLMELKNKEIILDCTSLNYISSSGLRLYFNLLKSSETNGNSIILENVNENIKKVFLQ